MLTLIELEIEDLNEFVLRKNNDGVTVADLCHGMRNSSLPLILTPFFSESGEAKSVIEIDARPAEKQVCDLLADNGSFLYQAKEQLENVNVSDWFCHDFAAYDLSKPLGPQVKPLSETTFHWVDTPEKFVDALKIL